VEAGAGGDLAEEGELADSSVLELDESEAVESLLIGVVEQAERIEEAEGWLGPSSFSKALRDVTVLATGAGANAAAEPMRVAMMAVFMFDQIIIGVKIMLSDI
jgi:hypothetical protein